MKPTCRSHSRTLRRGWMLVELIITLMIIAIAGGTASYLIVRMLRSSQVQADALVRERTLHGWEDQFRQDSRAASSAQLVPEKSSIQFHQGDENITYLSSIGGLERRVNDQLAGRWQTRGEWTFTLHENARIVRAELASAPELSSAEKLPQGQRAVPNPRLLRVDTAVGRGP